MSQTSAPVFLTREEVGIVDPEKFKAEVFGVDCTPEEIEQLKRSWIMRSAYGRMHILRAACPGLYETDRECYFDSEPLDELFLPTDSKFGYMLSVETCREIVRILREDSNQRKYR